MFASNEVDYAPLTNNIHFRAVAFDRRPVPLRTTDVAGIKSTDQSEKPRATFASNEDITITIRDGVVETPCAWQGVTVLPRLGAFHPISRSHDCFSKRDLGVVMQRLLRVFYFLSLQTTFRADSSVVQVHCRSLEQVEWVVQLWESREKVDVAIVEVQRVAGDGVIYHEYAQHVLKAVIASEETATASAPWSKRKAPQVPLLTCTDDVGGLPISECLDLCRGMLTSDRLDSRQLGLESLVNLTDPLKTDNSTALMVARHVLVGDAGCIRDRVLNLALLGRWPDTPATLAQTDMECQLCKRHSLSALMILANSVALVPQSDLAPVLEATTDITGVCLSTILEHRVNAAPTEPHVAYLATRILNVTYDKLIIAKDTVRQAHQFGQCSHVALETEAGLLLQAMDVTA